MNFLLRIALAITCVVLISSALLIVLVGLLASTSSASSPVFGELEDDRLGSQGPEVTDGR